MTIFVIGLIIGVILFIVAVMALHTVVMTEDDYDNQCGDCAGNNGTDKWCEYCEVKEKKS